MSESPLQKLSRIFGGVILSHGPLGHQVLGQMLIVNARDLEIAGATALVAATSGQRHAGLEAMVRIFAPALAVHLITVRDERRLLRLWERLDEREAALDARESAILRSQVASALRPGRPRRCFL